MRAGRVQRPDTSRHRFNPSGGMPARQVTFALDKVLSPFSYEGREERHRGDASARRDWPATAELGEIAGDWAENGERLTHIWWAPPRRGAGVGRCSAGDQEDQVRSPAACRPTEETLWHAPWLGAQADQQSSSGGLTARARAYLFLDRPQSIANASTSSRGAPPMIASAARPFSAQSRQFRQLCCELAKSRGRSHLPRCRSSTSS